MASPTQVYDPSTGVGRGNSQAASGAVAGAAQGAAAGAAVGSVVPVIGTAIGAVVGGVVGAVAGWFGGGQMDKATMHKRKAEKWGTLGKEREAAVARNQMLRDFRIARAEAAVQIGAEGGGMQGSATGALSAIGNQYVFSDAFFGGQTHIQKQTARHLRKAGRAQAAANTTFGYLDAASSLASTIGSFGLSFGSSATKVGLTKAQVDSVNIPFTPNI